MSDLVTLPPGAVLPERPFTHPANTLADLRALERTWETLRALHRSGALHPGSPESEGAAGETLLMREWCDDLGMTRRVVLNVLHPLEEYADIVMVGFCGQRRPGADPTDIHETDVELVRELHTHVDILCYFTHQQDSGAYVNLVLFRSEEAKALWAASRRHRYAVRVLSPLYYRSVRLHNGTIPGGLSAGLNGGQHGGAIHLSSTKYYDYLEVPSPAGESWRAIRYWQPPMTLEHGAARQLA
jgi:hypothetical protein